MRILELNFEKTWRGGERQTIYNMQGFRNAGCDVELVCRKNYPLARAASENGFNIHGFDSIFGVIGYLILHGHKYDILHVQASQVLTYAVLTKPFHRRKIIFTRRVDFVPRGKLTRLKYRATDILTGVSNTVKNIIETFCGKPVTVISDIVVPKQLNAERAKHLLRSLNISAGTHIIATTAAFVPHKDPLTMVEAIKCLTELRQDFVFLHFGTGELESAVKEKIQQYGLEKYYRLIGFHTDVEDYFSVFNVFAMSSQEEGLGSSVLDAFVYRVPVAGTDAGGLGEILGEGRAVVAPKRNPKKLAEAINELLTDKDKAQTIANTSYHYAIKYHSMEYLTKKYMELMKP
jgi:glycosyltransferase involved in cell wall biosynthesis